MDPRSESPAHVATVQSLTADLADLGVAPGMTVLVHTALSSLGFVIGGEQAVITALGDAVGTEGTLAMPAQSWQLCDPAYLNDPEVPPAWWSLIRESLPLFGPAVTPTRTMGRVAELFRTLPGVLRSGHPHRSFAASGPHARSIVARHDLDSPVGTGSPLQAMYELDARVLLLGVGYEKCTALHLAEARCDFPGKHTVRNGAPGVSGDRRTWVTWEEMWPAADDFAELGAAFAQHGGDVRHGRVGAARTQLVSMRGLVDYAAEWFPLHREYERFSGDGTAGSPG